MSKKQNAIKSQFPKDKYQMVRQAHHLITLSKVEGQITRTKISNDWHLILFEIWIL
jgi:hypothetical protein